MRAARRVRRQAKVLSYSDKNSMIQTALLFETVEEIYVRVLRELKPRAKPARIVVRFRPYVNVDSNVQLQEGHQCIEVKISDQLEGAPAPVQEALAQILLRKLYRKPVPKKYNHRYRMFLNRADMRRRSLLIRQIRGRKQMRSPQGHAYDLEEIFDELNARFFGGLLGRPRLSWSPRRSRRQLGHFDPAHNAIVVSRIFDHPETPRFLVEYILYHEMLHLKFPVEYRGNRRRVHTKEFCQEEKKFPRYEEAVEYLKQL